jgi:hypothetical protein
MGKWSQPPNPQNQGGAKSQCVGGDPEDVAIDGGGLALEGGGLHGIVTADGGANGIEHRLSHLGRPVLDEVDEDVGVEQGLAIATDDSGVRAARYTFITSSPRWVDRLDGDAAPPRGSLTGSRPSWCSNKRPRDDPKHRQGAEKV